MWSERFGTVRSQLLELKRLGEVLSLLHWDQEVHLPPKGAAGRGEQIALLTKLRHEKSVEKHFVTALEELSTCTALEDDQASIVREAWRDIRRAVKIPTPLVEKIALAESRTHHKWLAARKENRFSAVQDELKELVSLKREYGATLADGSGAKGGDAYDALLDLYEPGATGDEVAALFTSLRPKLTALTERGAAITIENPAQASFPKEDQKRFITGILMTLGFDLQEGRFDESVHPFCSDSGRHDVRLTTRYNERDLLPGLLAAIHEAGHGFYELGLPIEYYGTPLAEGCSMGIHESQSLLWEKQLGRSKEFWEFLFPQIQAHFPAAVEGVSFQSFYRYANRVKPSLIRVDADEVTYGLHVILRFELERALILGALQVEDLPEAWNEKYREYLGITPPEDLTGVLQDTHWYIGAFGYFPTYLLGAIYAAQLFRAYSGANPSASERFREGDFSELLSWLRATIHKHGRRYRPRELIERATGEAISAAPFEEYLGRKVRSLAELSA